MRLRRLEELAAAGGMHTVSLGLLRLTRRRPPERTVAGGEEAAAAAAKDDDDDVVAWAADEPVKRRAADGVVD